MLGKTNKHYARYADARPHKKNKINHKSQPLHQAYNSQKPTLQPNTPLSPTLSHNTPLSNTKAYTSKSYLLAYLESLQNNPRYQH